MTQEKPSGLVSVLSNADGSSLFIQPITQKANFLSSLGISELDSKPISIITAVNGPLEVSKKQEKASTGSLYVLVRPSDGVSSSLEKLFEQKIEKLLSACIVLDQYPRSVIQVVIQIVQGHIPRQKQMKISTYGDSSKDNETKKIEDDSNLMDSAANSVMDIDDAIKNNIINNKTIEDEIALDSSGYTDGLKEGKLYAKIQACAINSINLALLDARIEMMCTFAATSIETKDAVHLIIYEIVNNKVGRILLVESSGNFSQDDLILALEEAVGKCESLATYMRSLIEKSLI